MTRSAIILTLKTPAQTPVFWDSLVNRKWNIDTYHQMDKMPRLPGAYARPGGAHNSKVPGVKVSVGHCHIDLRYKQREDNGPDRQLLVLAVGEGHSWWNANGHILNKVLTLNGAQESRPAEVYRLFELRSKSMVLMPDGQTGASPKSRGLVIETSPGNGWDNAWVELGKLEQLVPSDDDRKADRTAKIDEIATTLLTPFVIAFGHVRNLDRIFDSIVSRFAPAD